MPNNRNNRNNKSSKNTRNNNVDESSLLIVIGFLVIVLLIIFHKRSKKIEPYQNGKRLVVFINNNNTNSNFIKINDVIRRENNSNETLFTSYARLHNNLTNILRRKKINKIILYPDPSLYSTSYIMRYLKNRENEGDIVINTTKMMEVILDKHDLKKKVSEMDDVNNIIIGQGKNDTNTINLIEDSLLKNHTIVIKAIVNTNTNHIVLNRGHNIRTEIGNFSKSNKNKFIIEKYLEYKKIHRILIINDTVIKRYSFVYNKNNNSTSSKFDETNMKINKEPSDKLINLAETVYNNLNNKIDNNEYKGIVAVDIYQTNNGRVYFSDINPIFDLMLYQDLAIKHFSVNGNISEKIGLYLNKI